MPDKKIYRKSGRERMKERTWERSINRMKTEC